jgi:hypothetical protein
VLRWLSRSILVSCCALAASCSYLHERGRDFAQVLHLGLGVSAPAGLNVHAQAIGTGIDVGYLREARYVGTDYGFTASWHEYAAGLVSGYQRRWHTADGEAPAAGAPPKRPHEDYYRGRLWLLDATEFDLRHRAPWIGTVGRVDAGVHVLVVGASAGVNWLELLDAVIGLTGLDLLGDDGEWTQPLLKNSEVPP